MAKNSTHQTFLSAYSIAKIVWNTHVSYIIWRMMSNSSSLESCRSLSLSDVPEESSSLSMILSDASSLLENSSLGGSPPWEENVISVHYAFFHFMEAKLEITWSICKFYNITYSLPSGIISVIDCMNRCWWTAKISSYFAHIYEKVS